MSDSRAAGVGFLGKILAVALLRLRVPPVAATGIITKLSHSTDGIK